MVAVIGLATWAGWKLDQYLNLSFPVFTFVFVLASIIGLVYKMIKMLADDE